MRQKVTLKTREAVNHSILAGFNLCKLTLLQTHPCFLLNETIVLKQ